MKSRHLSLRISDHDYEQLEALAHREGETVSEAARRLIEEGRRMAEHHGIVFRPGLDRREAAVMAGPAVWKIIDVFPDWDDSWDIRSSEELGGTSVTAWQAMVAQRYHRAFPEEIDELVRLHREAVDRAYSEWLSTQPAIAR